MKPPRGEDDPRDLSDDMAILDPLKSFNLQKVPKSVSQTNSSSLPMLRNLGDIYRQGKVLCSAISQSTKNKWRKQIHEIRKGNTT